MKNYDIIIVGGGPAGMTAALYSLRAGKSILILEKENFGGQIANSPRVENIPSIKEISGLDYSNNLFEQILNLGAEFELEEVNSIKKENDIFTITTNYSEYTSKAVIVATGVSHRHIGIDLVGAIQDFLTHLLTLPLVIGRDVRNLCLPLQCLQFTQRGQLMLLTAIVAGKVRAATFHLTFTTTLCTFI